MGWPVRTLWLGRAIVMVFLSLSSCHSFFDSLCGTLTPNDPFVFVGDNVTLECRLTTPDCRADCSHLFMTQQNQDVDSRYLQNISDHAVRLQYPMSEVNSSRLHFFCWVRCLRGQPKMVGNQYVRVDYPAGEVQNLACTALNWEELVCTWDLPYPYFDLDNVSVKVKLRKNGKNYPPTNLSKTWAMWTSKGNTFQWGFIYWLRVQVVYTGHSAISNTSSKSRIRTRSIVKPFPVLERREYNLTARSIRVRLYHSDNFHEKVLHVQYASQWNPRQWIKVKYAWHKKQARLVKFSGLKPFTNYTVKVAVGPGVSENGSLSDWSHFSLRTLPSAPEVAPELCPGCYTVGACTTPHHCLIRLYWKSIPPVLRNSRIKDYHLSQATGVPPVAGHSPCLKPGGAEEVRLVTTGTSGLLTVDGRNDSLLRLFARTLNDRWSGDCSLLFVPSIANRPAGVEDLVVEVDDADQSGGHWDGLIYLRWSDPGPQTSFFVVVWCPRTVKDHACQPGKDIEWQRVPENVTQLTLTVNTSNEHGGKDGPDDFIIGVVRHQRRQHDQGDVSSGIIWSSCIYLRAKAPRVRPDVVSLSQAQPGELHLSWTFTFCGSDVYVTHFDIVYCAVSSQGNDTCDGEEKTMTVGRRERKVAVLRGLEEGRAYRVRIAAVSPWGQGPLSPILSAVAPVRGKADGGSWAAVMVIPGSLGVIATLVCACCKLKRRYKKTTGKFAKTLAGKQELREFTDSLKGQVSDAFKPRSTAKQVSVNSETPLLMQDDVLEEEGEREVNLAGPVLDPGCPAEGEPGVTQKSASTQGSDAGVELRHSGGALEEVTVEGITESLDSDEAEHDQAPRRCGRTQNVNSAIRTAYVSPAPSQQVGTVTLPEEASPSSSDVTALGQEGVVCEDAARTVPSARPPRGGVQQDSADNGGLRASACPEEALSDVSSQPVWVEQTAAEEALSDVSSQPVWVEQTATEASADESGHSASGEGGAVTSACGGQASAYRVFDVSNKEASPCEDAFPTQSPIDFDVDEDEVHDSALTDPDLRQSSHDLNLTSHTLCTADTSLEVSSKDSGGRVVVSSHRVSMGLSGPYFPSLSYLASESQEEAVSMHGWSSSTESLNEDGQSFDTTNCSVVQDSCARAVVTGYSACVADPPPVQGYISNAQQSPVAVQASPQHAEQSPSSEGCTTPAPSNGYICHEPQPPVAGEAARCGYISQQL